MLEQLTLINISEVTAPGQDIISGWFAGDDVYTEATGTSLSTPHVAGTIALLLSVKPNLTVAEAKEYLIQSGVETATLRSRNRSCGGIEGKIAFRSDKTQSDSNSSI